MKKMILMAFVLTAITFTGAKAQDNGKDGKNREEIFKEMLTKQADKLAEDMKLSDDKAADFKTLFQEYKTKEMNLKFKDGQKKKGAGKQEKGKRQEMTDARADSLMTANFETQEQQLQLRKEYYAKFKAQIGAANAWKIFSPQQMMRPGAAGGQQNNRRGGFGGGFGGGMPGGESGMPGGGDF